MGRMRGIGGRGKMGEKGAGHLEMILSFVLFISVVSFAFFFFNPTGSQKMSDSSLAYAFNGIIKNTSTNLDTFSIKIKEPAKVSGDFILVPLSYSIHANENTRAEDYYGTKVLPSANSGGKILFSAKGNSFCVVKVSDGINAYSGSIGSPKYGVEEYILSSSSSRKIVSEKKMKMFKEAYEGKYDTIKEELGLPGNVDFSFSFAFSQSDFISGQKITPAEAQTVFSSIKRIEILREDGLVIFGELSISVW